MRPNVWIVLAALGSPVCVLAAPATQPAAEAAVAAEVLRLAGITKGLCLHLGCGAEGNAALTAELAAGSDMLVHGLATDDASLDRSRRAIEARGMLGRAMAEKVALRPLPYRNDLANLVVIEDFDALAKAGLTMEEVLRVTAPGGAVCRREGGKWTRTVKPRPKEMDEWTHPQHGPDGNMVSTDTVVGFPLGFRWMDGLPVNIKGFSDTRAWVLAGGRLFTLSMNEVENIGSPRGEEGYDHWLSAHDAFNGLPLWKVNCGLPDDGTAINWENVGPLAADDRRVYTAVKDKAIGVDAATGKTFATFETKCQPYRLVLLDNVLVAASWQEKYRPPWNTWVLVWMPKTPAGSVEGFDAATGARKWAFPTAAYKVLAADGVAYLMLRYGEPADKREVVALDLQTGKEKWRVANDKLGAQCDLELTCAGKGFVAIAKPKDKLLVVLSAKDGSVLWKTNYSGNWATVVDGLLWVGGGRYDPLTGQQKWKAPSWTASLHGQGCSPSTIAGGGRYILRARGCDYVELPSPGDTVAKPKALSYFGARAACVEGMVPAYGMLYTAQNACKCIPAHPYGFIAIGPVGDWPSDADFQATRPIEKGPAFGAVEAPSRAEDGWPTYRGNARRSAATAEPVPAKLRPAWKVQAARPVSGPLAGAWQSRLASCLTAPVVSDGKAFVCGAEEGTVLAYDAATGAKAWSAVLGSRIDTPPTIHGGLCVVGCHDGWVYALRASDGRLAWRSRAAPWERRMVAHGQVESVWPAVGAVLARDGVLYASAGRSSESDGGVAVVAMDAATGRQLWGRSIGPGVHRMNDLLLERNGNVAWRVIEMDPKSGLRRSPSSMPTTKEYGGGHGTLEGGVIDGTWTRMHNRRAGNAFTLGKITADLMAWNERVIVTGKGAFSRDAEAPLWKAPAEGGYQVTAVALAGDVVLFVGRVAPVKEGDTKGFLWLCSAADGKRILQMPLEAPVALDGLAVAQGRIYVSLENGALVCLGG